MLTTPLETNQDVTYSTGGIMETKHANYSSGGKRETTTEANYITGRKLETNMDANYFMNRTDFGNQSEC